MTLPANRSETCPRRLFILRRKHPSALSLPHISRLFFPALVSTSVPPSSRSHICPSLLSFPHLSFPPCIHSQPPRVVSTETAIYGNSAAEEEAIAAATADAARQEEEARLSEEEQKRLWAAEAAAERAAMEAQGRLEEETRVRRQAEEIEIAAKLQAVRMAQENERRRLQEEQDKEVRFPLPSIVSVSSRVRN